ncbi:TrbI/VirB10 family protein [Novosphingobium sp. ERN07]|uniref:TrbI/VirB10 family protein n=1 Tax=Novosphingobium sp. ERN07 TaxID=2726187 RepID=UPI001456DFC0|nr:TrbI/VirB10 family protein [Novosphingobium sp. ERN07]NLR73388.1 TrbI/VirB10 family protein [Novosphingobium sp. ERN07]
MKRFRSGGDELDPRTEVGADELALASFNGYPAVARHGSRSDRAGLMLGGSIALLLGATTFFNLSLARSDDEVGEAPSSDVFNPVKPVGELPEPVFGSQVANVPVSTPEIRLSDAESSDATNITMDSPPTGSVQGAATGPSPAVVFDSGAQDAGSGRISGFSDTTKAGFSEAGARVSRSSTDANDDQLAGNVMPVGERPRVSAESMIAPHATVAEGVLISAVLETAINSDLPGFVRAVISRDVRSFDGTTVLIPRGSHVIGEYKSGLAVGQTRAYVLWTRLMRPDGVSIALASPATDTVGENGLTGKVNGHFGKRFGMALLLSLINAGGQALGGGGAVVIAGPSQVATSSLQREVGIPPTVRVSAGMPIGIFVARDLDFSGLGEQQN